MDPAIALVQAYLRVNGYFTVTDYPLFEKQKGGEVRAVTDLDVLGIRLGHRGERASQGEFGLHGVHRTDPTLVTDPTRTDMIIAEVKGGSPRFNDATLEPHVLATALAVFGGCAREEAHNLADALLSRGSAATSDGGSVRVIAFGSGRPDARDRRAYSTISLEHVTDFLESYLHGEWESLRQVDIHEPALDMLQLLMKARSGE